MVLPFLINLDRAATGPDARDGDRMVFLSRFVALVCTVRSDGNATLETPIHRIVGTKCLMLDTYSFAETHVLIRRLF